MGDSNYCPSIVEKTNLIEMPSRSPETSTV